MTPSEIPRRARYGDGVFRRRIRVETLAREGAGALVLGALEDDFHHFRARVRHDGSRVVEVRGEGVRTPWTTCAGAVDPLAALRGAPVDGALSRVAGACDPRLQCTHLFDAAVLAVAVTARGHDARCYDAAIPDRRDGRTRVTLARDGEPLLAWDVDGMRVEGPEPFADRPLAGGFLAWCEAELDPELAEAAFVLRRALFIGLGRQYDFERIERASDFAAMTGTACHTFQPGRVEGASRVHGTVRELSDVDFDALAPSE